jgi:hypothetical protein
MAVGLKMVNLVYLTGGWLTQFTPTMEDDIGPKGVGEGRLTGVVGDWEGAKVVVEEEEELVELGPCFPMRMFSTVKLEIVLLLGVFSNFGVLFLNIEDLSACSELSLHGVSLPGGASISTSTS